MSDSDDIVERWSMPNDLGNWLYESANKTYAPEDDLKGALEDLARDIDLIELNQIDWGVWVIYLLERMEEA